MGTAHYVAAHCNALVQPRSRFHPLYSPQKALNWGGGRAWHKALNKFFKLPSHHLCSVFFPQRGLPLNSVHACISFGFLVLTQTTRQETTLEPGIWLSICAFACLWISYFCICMFMNILLVSLRVWEYEFCVFVCVRLSYLCTCPQQLAHQNPDNSAEGHSMSRVEPGV